MSMSVRGVGEDSDSCHSDKLLLSHIDYPYTVFVTGTCILLLYSVSFSLSSLPLIPPAASRGFDSSLFIYIIVPGIVVSMAVIVVSIVICKKAREKRKRGVAYAKGELGRGEGGGGGMRGHEC